MNRHQYLEKLKMYLSRLPESEREDILRDQEEFINDSMSSGRSEADTLASLGSPRDLASSLIAELKVQRLESSESLNRALRNSVPAFFAVLALAPLNIFLAAGPFVIIVVFLGLGWFFGAGITLGILGAFIVFLSKAIFVDVDILVHVSTAFFILGSLSLSVFAMGILALISKVFVRITIAYLRWNLELLRRVAN